MLRLLALLAALVPAACGEDSGPADIKFERDVCEMCGMIISDAHYVAQVRTMRDNKIHKFDDVGDAMNWLENQCLGLAGAKEIWVMDSDDGKAWLDARKASYRHANTPMNYGFAAVRVGGETTVSFEEMRAQVLRPAFACKSINKSKADQPVPDHRDH